MEMGKIIIKAILDATDFDKGIKELKEDNKDVEIEVISDEQSNIFQKVLGFTKKIGTHFLGISKSSLKLLGNITTLLAKLGAIGGLIGIVALIGVGLVKAFTDALKKNEELSTKVKYLGFVIREGFGKLMEGVANALVKAFEWIIDGLLDMLVLFGGIIKLITGINIFASATADNFAKANKSAGALRKTLAGFDEMNVLNGDSGVGLASDLSNYLDKLRDVGAETEAMAGKIKKWFLGEGNENIVESIVNNFKQLPHNLVEIFTPLYESVVKPYLVGPFIEGFNEIKNNSEPIWRPMYSSFEKTISDIKNEFSPFIDWIDKNIISGLKTRWENYKRDFLKTYGPFINTIIAEINKIFGIFGVHLDYIEIESDTTGEKIEKNLGEAFDNTTEKEKTTFDWAGELFDKLVELTTKDWKINTNVAVNGGGIKDWYNNWLRTKLRETVGISLPYLAQGGIVNMPGRGVPVGNAYAGERGAEGVIPLTDSQQMALLGEAIGKYININATVPVYVGNRMVAKEIKRINAEDDFAYNR